MHTDSTLIPLSALQHYAFCPRQCALIHVEREWAENRLTAEGRLLHTRVHEQQVESRGNVIVCRGLHIRSLSLGLSGQTDVVELHAAQEGNGVTVAGRRGRWLPIPVEYKRGKPKKDNCDAVQLCAQGICLEEMMDAVIPHGFLFYGKSRRRTAVVFDQPLRAQTSDIAMRVHELLSTPKLPPPANDPRCERCSLRDACVPSGHTQGGYVLRQVRAILREKEQR